MNKNILTISLLMMLLISSSIYSQLSTINPMWTFEGGYTILNVDNSDASLGGYSIFVNYDDIQSRNLAGGITFGYMVTTTETDDVEYAYSSLPFVIQGKYFFTEKVPIFGQAGIGIHFSALNRTTEQTSLKTQDVGLILNAGLGVLIPLSKSLYISAAYQFNWYNTSFYNNGLVHQFKLGLAFN